MALLTCSVSMIPLHEWRSDGCYFRLYYSSVHTKVVFGFGPRAGSTMARSISAPHQAQDFSGWARHICMPNIAAMWLDLGPIAYEVARAVEIPSDLTRSSDIFVPDSRRAWTRLV